MKAILNLSVSSVAVLAQDTGVQLNPNKSCDFDLECRRSNQTTDAHTHTRSSQIHADLNVESKGERFGSECEEERNPSKKKQARSFCLLANSNGQRRKAIHVRMRGSALHHHRHHPPLDDETRREPRRRRVEDPGQHQPREGGTGTGTGTGTGGRPRAGPCSFWNF